MSAAMIVLSVTSVALAVVAIRQARQPKPKPMLIRNRRVLEAHAHEELLLAAGACGHVKGAAAPGCDCRMGRPW